MKFWALYAAFIVSAAIIFLTLTKRKMKSARTFFVAMSLYVGVTSACMMFINANVTEHLAWVLRLSQISTYMLGISIVLFNVATLVVIVATIVLAVFAIKKIVKCLATKYILVGDSAKFSFPRLPKFNFQRKFFILFCRLIS